VSNLYQILENSANRYPDNGAVIFRDHVISYRSLKEAVDRLAAGMKSLGLGPGDRIALMLPNVPHFPIGYYAALKIGAMLVTLSGSYRADEVHRRLEDSEAKAILFFEGFRPYVRQAVHGLDRCRQLLVLGNKAQPGEIRLNYLIEANTPLEETASVHPDDTALIVYTGGMSGHVKGAELTHANLLSNADACFDFLKLQPADGVVGVMPLSHPIGQTLVMNTFLRAGGQMALLPRFDAKSVLKTIETHKLTHFVGVPSMFGELGALPEPLGFDLAFLKFGLSTGDGLRQETLEAFEAKFKIPVLEGYGLTEASPMVSFNSPVRERRAGSIGLPLPGIEMKIVDENEHEVRPGQVGEIIVQGPNVMKGYLNRPEATHEVLKDGWLRTGDLAMLDESGFGFIVARKKNVIVKSGFSVYPVEVERYLAAHPKIQEAVVVGLPDPAQGEEIHAYVVVREGEQATESEIIDYVRERIALYKCPKSISFVPSLPKGPTGRVLRDKVKQMLMDKANQTKSSFNKGGVS
jgi:long-chain acyl-CoA synthetase